MEPLATKDEVAEYLKIQPKTLDVWASQQKGPPFIRVEGARRYDMADVREWLEARKVRH
jgi:DNA-binding transcriptional MerR regulator